MRGRLVALLVVAALALSGCGGEGGGRLSGAPRGTQDINSRDPATLRDGGDLRFPLDNLPTNYNSNQVDGNEEQTLRVISALMPRAFTDAPDGGVEMDTDFVTDARVTSTAPQVVSYHINDAATWSTGRPITWEDFAAQVSALNGTNPAYLIADKTGYQDIAKVARGATDKDVVVTFGKTFSEWKGLFYRLYPKETNASPDAFNTGSVQSPQITAGPFTVGAVDQTAKTITLVRNERWWGPKPRLSRIIFTVTDRNALADRLANNEIDLYEIGSSVDLFRRAQTIPGVQIREATPKQYSFISFNGGPGAVLSDLALRRAIAQGINPGDIARRLIGQIVPTAVPIGNHIYPVGAKDYRDNSDVLRFDQAAANRALDALGWVRPSPGAMRAKSGSPLRLRFISIAGNPISDAIAKATLNQLAQIGVGMDIEAVSPVRFFADYVNRSNFDLTSYQLVGQAVPLSNSVGNFQPTSGTDVGNNFGRIADPRIGPLFAQALAELDDAKRAELGNQIDRLIWEEVHDVLLYPQTGAWAVRSTLANIGAKGLGDWDYVPVGYVR